MAYFGIKQQQIQDILFYNELLAKSFDTQYSNPEKKNHLLSNYLPHFIKNSPSSLTLENFMHTYNFKMNEKIYKNLDHVVQHTTNFPFGN